MIVFSLSFHYFLCGVAWWLEFNTTRQTSTFSAFFLCFQHNYCHVCNSFAIAGIESKQLWFSTST